MFFVVLQYKNKSEHVKNAQLLSCYLLKNKDIKSLTYLFCLFFLFGQRLSSIESESIFAFFRVVIFVVGPVGRFLVCHYNYVFVWNLISLI